MAPHNAHHSPEEVPSPGGRGRGLVIQWCEAKVSEWGLVAASPPRIPTDISTLCPQRGPSYTPEENEATHNDMFPCGTAVSLRCGGPCGAVLAGRVVV
eukprot:gene10428-biopygen5866